MKVTVDPRTQLWNMSMQNQWGQPQIASTTRELKWKTKLNKPYDEDPQIVDRDDSYPYTKQEQEVWTDPMTIHMSN